MSLLRGRVTNCSIAFEPRLCTLCRPQWVMNTLKKVRAASLLLRRYYIKGEKADFCTSWYFRVLLRTSRYFLYFSVLLCTSWYFSVLLLYFSILLGTSCTSPYFSVLLRTSRYFFVLLDTSSYHYAPLLFCTTLIWYAC